MKFIAWPLFALLFLSSCDDNEFPDYDNKEIITFEEEQGNYRAEFKTLNKKWADKVQGYSILWLRGNQFYVRVSLTTGKPHIQHLQFIHEGAKCPMGPSADLTGDGVIDFNEVVAVAGKALVPLDGDLTRQSAGEMGFPRTDDEGKYIYYKAASFREMMQDLRGKANGRYGKIPIGAPLRLHERIIVIYGIAESATFPIACGEIYADYGVRE